MKNKPAIIATLKIKTDEGNFLARYSSTGLAGLHFPNAKSNGAASTSAALTVKRWHELTIRAVNQVLQGRPITAAPPMDLSSGTAFQKQVWTAMQTIPPGRTETYAGLAAILKKPKAARAVGGACGANPIPLIIPCHRIVAAHGALGGFSSGLRWKRELLGREAAKGK